MVELYKIHIRFGKNTYMQRSVLYQKFTINKNIHVYLDSSYRHYHRGIFVSITDVMLIISPEEMVSHLTYVEL